MSIEADITAFLLIHERIERRYDGTELLDDWSYVYDPYVYDVVNLTESTISFRVKWSSRDPIEIDKKDGCYTEQEALEIMAKHWKENGYS